MKNIRCFLSKKQWERNRKNIRSALSMSEDQGVENVMEIL